MVIRPLCVSETRPTTEGGKDEIAVLERRIIEWIYWIKRNDIHVKNGTREKIINLKLRQLYKYIGSDYCAIKESHEMVA